MTDQGEEEFERVKGNELLNIEKVHDIAMTLSTVLPKYPTNTSWPVVVVVPGEDKEDHASVVQLDPGGMEALQT